MQNLTNFLGFNPANNPDADLMRKSPDIYDNSVIEVLEQKPDSVLVAIKISDGENTTTIRLRIPTNPSEETTRRLKRCMKIAMQTHTVALNKLISLTEASANDPFLSTSKDRHDALRAEFREGSQVHLNERSIWMLRFNTTMDIATHDGLRYKKSRVRATGAKAHKLAIFKITNESIKGLSKTASEYADQIAFIRAQEEASGKTVKSTTSVSLLSSQSKLIQKYLSSEAPLLAEIRPYMSEIEPLQRAAVDELNSTIALLESENQTLKEKMSKSPSGSEAEKIKINNQHIAAIRGQITEIDQKALSITQTSQNLLGAFHSRNMASSLESSKKIVNNGVSLAEEAEITYESTHQKLYKELAEFEFLTHTQLKGEQGNLDLSFGDRAFRNLGQKLTGKASVSISKGHEHLEKARKANAKTATTSPIAYSRAITSFQPMFIQQFAVDSPIFGEPKKLAAKASEILLTKCLHHALNNASYESTISDMAAAASAKLSVLEKDLSPQQKTHDAQKLFEQKLLKKCSKNRFLSFKPTSKIDEATRIDIRRDLTKTADNLKEELNKGLRAADPDINLSTEDEISDFLIKTKAAFESIQRAVTAYNNIVVPHQTQLRNINEENNLDQYSKIPGIQDLSQNVITELKKASGIHQDVSENHPQKASESLFYLHLNDLLDLENKVRKGEAVSLPKMEKSAAEKAFDPENPTRPTAPISPEPKTAQAVKETKHQNLDGIKIELDALAEEDHKDTTLNSNSSTLLFYDAKVAGTKELAMDHVCTNQLSPPEINPMFRKAFEESGAKDPLIQRADVFVTFFLLNKASASIPEDSPGFGTLKEQIAEAVKIASKDGLQTVSPAVMDLVKPDEKTLLEAYREANKQKFISNPDQAAQLVSQAGKTIVFCDTTDAVLGVGAEPGKAGNALGDIFRELATDPEVVAAALKSKNGIGFYNANIPEAIRQKLITVGTETLKQEDITALSSERIREAGKEEPSDIDEILTELKDEKLIDPGRLNELQEWFDPNQFTTDANIEKATQMQNLLSLKKAANDD